MVQQVRHERRRHDEVAVGVTPPPPRQGTIEIPVEKATPLLEHQFPTLRRRTGSDPASGITIDNQKAMVGDLAPRAGRFELAGVERPVATAADDDDLTYRPDR